MPPKAHLNGSKGDPQKGIFWPQKCHFPDFPILTSVGEPWDRNSMTNRWKMLQRVARCCNINLNVTLWLLLRHEGSNQECHIMLQDVVCFVKTFCRLSPSLNPLFKFTSWTQAICPETITELIRFRFLRCKNHVTAPEINSPRGPSCQELRYGNPLNPL